jgi:hypothetical protein
MTWLLSTVLPASMHRPWRRRLAGGRRAGRGRQGAVKGGRAQRPSARHRRASWQLSPMGWRWPPRPLPPPVPCEKP